MLACCWASNFLSTSSDACAHSARPRGMVNPFWSFSFPPHCGDLIRGQSRNDQPFQIRGAHVLIHRRKTQQRHDLPKRGRGDASPLPRVRGGLRLG
jgi:hypothetical protein